MNIENRNNLFRFILRSTAFYSAATLAILLLAIVACEDSAPDQGLGPVTLNNGVPPDRNNFPDPSLCVSGRIVTDEGLTCATDCDGKLSCWGFLTDRHWSAGGTLLSGATPMLEDKVFVDLKAGGGGFCAVSASGELWCWGEMRSTGVSDGWIAPTRIGDATDWTKASVSRQGLCGIKSDESLWCWKGGDELNEPEQVDLATNWVDVAGDSATTCAISADHNVYCWGYVYDPDESPNPEPFPRDRPEVFYGDFVQVVTTGDGICLRNAEDKIICRGPRFDRDGDRVEVGKDHTWLDLGSAMGEICGLDSDNTLRCSAKILPSQEFTRFGPMSSIPFVAVSVDSLFDVLCALDSAGTPHCMGTNSTGQVGPSTSASRWVPTKVSNGPYKTVVVGESSSCAIDQDDSPVCWGLGVAAPLQEPAPEAIVAIATSIIVRCAIGVSGKLYCRNRTQEDWEQIGSDDDWVGLGSSFSKVDGVREQGGLYTIGGNLEVEGFETDKVWRQVASDLSLDCGLREVWTIWCGETYGGLTRVGDNELVYEEIFVHHDTVCGRTTDGETHCGEFGREWELNGRFSEWRIAFYKDAWKVGCGLTKSGTIECVNSAPNSSLLGSGDVVGSDTTEIDSSDWTHLSLSQDHACGLRGQGEIWCWGNGEIGQVGLGDAFVQNLTPLEPNTP